MRLADKRKVIEVLLCCGDPAHDMVESDMPCSRATSRLAERELDKVDAWLYPGITMEDCSADYTEAAYRLIESSPTLRREWFSRSKRSVAGAVLP